MNANLAQCHRVVTHPKPKSRSPNPELSETKPKTQMFWVSFGISTYLAVFYSMLFSIHMSVV